MHIVGAAFSLKICALVYSCAGVNASPALPLPRAIGYETKRPSKMFAMPWLDV